MSAQDVAEPEGGNKGDSESAGSAIPTEITGFLTLGGREPLLRMLECCCLAGKDKDGGSWGLGAAPRRRAAAGNQPQKTANSQSSLAPQIGVTKKYPERA